MSAHLSLYQQLSTLHDQMAEAAFAQNWDGLVQLERKCAELTHALQKTTSVVFSPEERHLAAALIRHILEKQAFIRNEVESWRTDATPLLATLNSTRST